MFSMSPAETCRRETCLGAWRKSGNINRHESCRLPWNLFFSHLWSDTFFDHWPTHSYYRAPPRVRIVTERQASHRVIVKSRRDQDRERIFVLHRLFAFVHWLSLSFRSSWIFEGFPVLLNSNPCYSSCVSMLQSLSRILTPLVLSKRM